MTRRILAYLTPAARWPVRKYSYPGRRNTSRQNRAHVIGGCATNAPGFPVFKICHTTGHWSRCPLPGSFVEVEIEGPAYKDVFVLPASVLQEGDSVWTVRDGVLRSTSPTGAWTYAAAGLVVEAFDAGEGLVNGYSARRRLKGWRYRLLVAEAAQ